MENTENTIICKTNSVNIDTTISIDNTINIDNSEEKMLNSIKKESDIVSINISNENKILQKERTLKANSIISQSDSLTQINSDSFNIPNETQNNTKKELKKSTSLNSQTDSVAHTDSNTIEVMNENENEKENEKEKENKNEKENENEKENDTHNTSEQKEKAASFVSQPDAISIVISNATEDNEDNKEDEHKKKLHSILSQSESLSIDISNITEVDKLSSATSESKTINILNDTDKDSKIKVKKSNSIISKSDTASKDVDDNQEKQEKQKKKKGFIYIVVHLIIWLISLVVFILMCYGYFCLICSINEGRDLEDLDKKYFNKTEVNEHYMSFNIVGNENNKTTIVILPRMGSPSPIIEYKPLAEALSSKYRVVTIEPFGYGFSEDVGDNRTMENIIYEFHEFVKKIGIDKYYLMGHSLGGLYSLKWAKDYTNEVLGFIGLDSSVPGIEKIETEEKFLAEKDRAETIHKLGLNRLNNILKSDLLPIDHSYKYTDDELKIEKFLINKKAFSKGIVEDIKNYYGNLSKLSGAKFPDQVPVLSFVSSESNKKFDKWNDLQHQVLGNNTRNEVIILDGPHNIHYEQKDAIVKKVKEWIN
jgi:pimeloyl-ACP methyl ester carboxylesterase